MTSETASQPATDEAPAVLPQAAPAWPPHPLGGSGHLFDRAFVIRPVSPGLYRARISTGFSGVPNRPIGSYVLAFALRCMLHHAGADYPDAVSIHAHFYSSPPLGSEVEIALRERRRGRALLFLDAEITLPRQGKEPEPVISAQGILGHLPAADLQLRTARFTAPAMPPPPDDCRDLYAALFADPTRPPKDPQDVDRAESVSVLADPSRLSSALALITAPDATPLDLARASLGPVWMLHPDGRPLDQSSLCFFADQPPPANAVLTMRRRALDGQKVLMPSTVTLSVHFHCRPARDALRCVNVSGCGLIAAGETEGKNDNEILLFDEGGHLLCSSRQVVHTVAMGGKEGGEGREQLFGKEKGDGRARM